MKFTYVPPTPQGWAEIQTARVDFDANPPVDRLRVCWPLGEANVDRTAVAASLVFAPWTAGGCDFLRPFSALTGQRITEWFQEASVWVSPTPIRAGGLPLPRGRRRFRLSGDGGDELRLALVDSLLGSSESDEEVRVASNLRVLMANAPTRASSFEMRLGVAVLVADSLSVNEFIDPEFAAEEPQSFTHAQRLLESVALGLRNA